MESQQARLGTHQRNHTLGTAVMPYDKLICLDYFKADDIWQCPLE